MHVVMQNFDVRTAPEYADPSRSALDTRWSGSCDISRPCTRTKLTLVSFTMLVSPTRRRQAPAVKNRVLPRLALKRDEPLFCVP